jgi:hypothetical protein
MDPDIYRQRVEVRMRRQEVLDRDNRPRYRVLLDESVLRRPVGGPDLMVAQIDKILQAEREGKATIQIIPFDFGVPASQDSNFVLLEFDDTTKISPTVFVDYLCYSALTAHDSVKQLTEMRKHYGGH